MAEIVIFIAFLYISKTKKDIPARLRNLHISDVIYYYRSSELSKLESGYGDFL